MRRFIRNERGNIAITFALALIPVCILIGGAMDFSRAMSAKRQLRDTLDGAALAIAGVPNFTQPQAEQIAKDFATANFPSQAIGAPAKIDSVTFDDISVNINGSANVPTTMLDLIGMTDIKVTTTTVVDRSGWNVEAAVALDITGSMAGSRLTALKTAAKDFVDTVVQDVQSPYTSKVALAPYSNAVFVGSTMAPLVRGTASASCNTYGCSTFKFTDNGSGSCSNNLNTGSDKTTKCTWNINNCVVERTGADAYTDATPAAGSYLTANYRYSGDPCPTSPIVPLSDNKTTLKNAVNGLSAAGNTAGHIGIAWAWYLLSPNFSTFYPAASKPNSYSDKKTMKVAVLMTDGEFNTMYCQGVDSADTGRGANAINCNAPNGNSFTQAKKLCAAMKKQNIIIYTIGFTIAKGGNAESVLKECASAPNAPYFNTPKTNADLLETFKTVAKSISQLRISH